MDFKNLLSKNKDIDILANIPDGVMQVNSDGIVEWINEKGADIFRTDKSFLLKKDFKDLVESGLELLKQASANSQSVVGKLKFEKVKDCYIEITAQSINDCYVVCYRDVTQNYKTVTNLMLERESSKKNNKDKNKFLVKLSNELKSPLQTIVGFSQAMIEGLGGEMGEKQDKYVRIINKSSVDALNFMNKIIELAKTESKLFEYNNQIFDVVNTAKIVLKEFEPEAKEKNLSWLFDAEQITKKSVFCDEEAIKVILKNILEICLKTTDIGSVSVKMSYPERDVVTSHGLEVPEMEEDYNEKVFLMFTITDTGEGFSNVEQEDLFEPYLQLDKPNKKNIIQSIALASVKNLVNHLKGKIWVESELMQGTSYYVIIPVER